MNRPTITGLSYRKELYYICIDNYNCGEGVGMTVRASNSNLFSIH